MKGKYKFLLAFVIFLSIMSAYTTTSNFIFRFFYIQNKTSQYQHMIVRPIADFIEAVSVLYLTYCLARAHHFPKNSTHHHSQSSKLGTEDLKNILLKKTAGNENLRSSINQKSVLIFEEGDEKNSPKTTTKSPFQQQHNSYAYTSVKKNT